MPSLFFDTTIKTSPTTHSHPSRRSRSPSPRGPPYSPITPVLPIASLHPPSNTTTATPSHAHPPPPTYRQPSPSHQPRPHAPSPFHSPNPQTRSPRPISLDTNSDAIALRAAISILQLQRQRSIRDLQTLERQKRAAVADAQGFARAIADGRVRTAAGGGVLHRPVNGGMVGGDKDEGAMDTGSDGEGARGGGEQEATGGGEERGKEWEERGKEWEERGKEWEEIPGSQNVVRCPPVEWAKYHVLAEPLGRLHEEQRKEEGVVAGPWRAWGDEGGRRKGRGVGD